MGWVGEEDNAELVATAPAATTGSRAPCQRSHPRPQGVTGVVAAEDDAAMAVVVVLVPRVDDD